jgi:hypothetical protein
MLTNQPTPLIAWALLPALLVLQPFGFSYEARFVLKVRFVVTASPLDVRKVSDLPGALDYSWVYALSLRYPAFVSLKL